MKKTFITIVAFVYLLSAIGITVHIHYCMDKLVGWGLMKTGPGTCGVCGMEKSEKEGKGCCKDESKFLKNTDDQKTTETSIQLMHSASAGLPVSFIDIPSVQIASVVKENPLNHTLFRSSVAVYIRNCIFRI